MVWGRLQVAKPHRGRWRDGIYIDWQRKPQPGDATWTTLDGRRYYVPKFRFIHIQIQW